MIRDGLRPLGDLLEHEVVVAALLGGGGVQSTCSAGRPRRRRSPSPSPRPCAARRPGPGPARSPSGCARCRRRPRPGTPRPPPRRPRERRVAAGAHDHVRGVRVHHDQRERALQAAAHQPHRLGESRRAARTPRRAGAPRPRCRSRRQDVSPLGELGAERGEVLDDAVVDDGDPARCPKLRVRVGVRATVGGLCRVCPMPVAPAGREPGPPAPSPGWRASGLLGGGQRPSRELRPHPPSQRFWYSGPEPGGTTSRADCEPIRISTTPRKRQREPASRPSAHDPVPRALHEPGGTRRTPRSAACPPIS